MLWIKIFLCVLGAMATNAYQPSIGPFFYSCNYLGNVHELGIDKGEVAVGVSIEGNPESYIPEIFTMVGIINALCYNRAICNTLQTALKCNTICNTSYFKLSCEGNTICNILQIASNSIISSKNIE